MNGWLIEDEDEPLEHEASDKEVDSDFESTASSKPMMKKTTKADPDRASRAMWNGENGGNGRNNGCTYKGFMTCNPKEYDGKGGAIALTRWIKKMENVIDNGANHAGYTNRFHELDKLVPHPVTPESSRIKRYIGGLAPEIQGMLRATQPTTIQSAILKAGILTDEAVSYGTLTKGNEKRKGVEESSKQGGGRNDNKRAKVAPINAVRGGYEPGTCYECGSRKHYRNTCPKLNLAPVSALQDPNVMTGTFSLNHHYATVLFDFGANFSFISTSFAPLLNVKSSFVNPKYLIEVADGKKVEVDRVIRNCKLELGTSLFTIDLIPLGHGSFDVIVRMDWLSENKAEIVCHEKVVRIPLESGVILIVQGERTPEIVKALSNVKVDAPKLSDIFVLRDFVEVFPENLSELPPQRQVEFWIDLVSGATLVAKSPYRLAPSEMQKLSAQLQELELNNLTIKNRYPLPRIDDLFDQLQGALFIKDRPSIGLSSAPST
nr:hypothetical protein [Tanacetum cinerariifolium]